MPIITLPPESLRLTIAADGLGVPAERLELVSGDTARTADAGKTSASRQTYVSGKAALLMVLPASISA